MSARLDELLDEHWRILSNGDRARADALLERMLDEFPSDPDVVLWWGHARARTDVDEARSVMLRAAELAGDDPSRQIRIGAALHSIGAIDEALACAKRAQACMPPDFEGVAPLANLVGRIAASKGRLDHARTALKSAFELEPEHPFVAHDLAEFLLRHDGRDAALEVLRQLPDELRDDDPARALLAELERADQS